jgi:hypothetical protein
MQAGANGSGMDENCGVSACVEQLSGRQASEATPAFLACDTSDFYYILICGVEPSHGVDLSKHDGGMPNWNHFDIVNDRKLFCNWTFQL